MARPAPMRIPPQPRLQDCSNASDDATLQQRCAFVPSLRVKSLLVHPIHANHSDKVLAVMLAINKREADGTSDIFFESFFTEADWCARAASC